MSDSFGFSDYLTLYQSERSYIQVHVMTLNFSSINIDFYMWCILENCKLTSKDECSKC